MYETIIYDYLKAKEIPSHASISKTIEKGVPQFKKLILIAEVGSTAHGISDGKSDDLDLTGIGIESDECIYGLDNIDQWLWRTQEEGLRSAKGDVDFVAYSLKKFMNLAVQGNPSILNLLYVDPKLLIKCTEEAEWIRDAAPLIVSKQAVPRFQGYMRAQALRFIGLKGSGHGKRGGARREEYICEFGYDTKFAAHMVRLGYQCIELLDTGQFSVPMRSPDRQIVKDIRLGKWTAHAVFGLAVNLDGLIEKMLPVSELRSSPDRKAINKLMKEIYLNE